MATAPKLKVVWPNGPTVFVDVDVEPVVKRDVLDNPANEDADLRPARSHISRVELVSEDTMHRFLRRITRGEAGGATVHALIFEPRVPDLLQVLGVPHPTPSEFEVRLPNG